MNIILADTGSYLVIAGIVFFLVMAAAAYITFKLLARTVKMTLRLLIAAVMFLAATGGGSALWYWGKQESRAPSNRQTPAKGTAPR